MRDVKNTALVASIQYLARDPCYEWEKPYYLYTKSDYGISRTNTQADDQLVTIHNARNMAIVPGLMFPEYGFTQLPFDCSLIPEEYTDSEKVKEVLYPKYKAVVQSLFPDAARIEVLEHAVRKRDTQWPQQGRERYEFRTNQPSDYVHIDMTASAAAKCSIKVFDIHPRSFRRFVVVNLWKPIRGPVYDFPLTLCDRRTVNYALQTTSMDIVADNYANENTRLYYSSDHRWYYWEALRENEIIVFVQADSQAEDSAGVPHTAFINPRVEPDLQLRESIEARVFVFFE